MEGSWDFGGESWLSRLLSPSPTVYRDPNLPQVDPGFDPAAITAAPTMAPIPSVWDPVPLPTPKPDMSGGGVVNGGAAPTTQTSGPLTPGGTPATGNPLLDMLKGVTMPKPPEAQKVATPSGGPAAPMLTAPAIRPPTPMKGGGLTDLLSALSVQASQKPVQPKLSPLLLQALGIR